MVRGLRLLPLGYCVGVSCRCRNHIECRLVRSWQGPSSPIFCRRLRTCLGWGWGSCVVPLLTHDDTGDSLLWVSLLPGLGGPHESSCEIFAAVHTGPYSVSVVDPSFIAVCVFTAASCLGAVCVVQAVCDWFALLLFHCVSPLVCGRTVSVSVARSCPPWWFGFVHYSPYLRGRACRPVLPETSAISSVILVNRLPFSDPSARAFTRYNCA